jgi:hypothetical protein
MPIKRFLREREDAAPDEDEGGGEDARRIQGLAAEGQELLDGEELSLSAATWVRDVLSLFRELTGDFDTMTNESLRAKNYAGSLLEGRRPGDERRRDKQLQKFVKKLKGG